MPEIAHYIACFTAGILLSGYMWERFAMRTIDRECDRIHTQLDQIAKESQESLDRLVRQANERHRKEQDR